MQTAEPLWVFGYGSLMWRTDFATCERRPGFIRDYQRRFWQGSTDHRGVPDSPGRVVTLMPHHGSRCWGVAYRVEEADRADVLAQLDHREKGGYVRLWESVRAQPGATPFARALVYMATPQNPNYLGPSSLRSMVEQIVRSRGPSGSNADYVLELARALRAMDVVDDHVQQLERSLLEHLGTV